MSEGGVYFSAPSRTRVLPVALILLPSIASSSRPSGKVQVWGRPRIHRIGDSAIVVIEFWNSGSSTATADFDVELSVDGAFVDSTSDSVEVGPGQRVTRQFSFDARSQGAASVNVQFR